jgi:uncharacterized Zn finger protein (UPF0148 family)
MPKIIRLINECPHCGDALEMDPDGGYCPSCEEYFSVETLQDYADEEDLADLHIIDVLMRGNDAR